MMFDVISICGNILSIILAIYAIIFSRKEAKKSQDNYSKTKDLLGEVDHKVDMVDRGIQFMQDCNLKIINKLLEREDKDPVEFKPITLQEIDEFVGKKTAASQKRIEELENIINSTPKIFVQKEEPTDSKDGDIWLKIED